jgi:hypothetical protein
MEEKDSKSGEQKLSEEYLRGLNDGVWLTERDVWLIEGKYKILKS